MDQAREQSLYEAVGGADGVLALARAWHERVLADPVVSHAFHDGLRSDHTERLAAYWGQQLGGPAAYTATMGDQSLVVRLHSGNGEHQEMDERAVDCFVAAVDDAGLSDRPEVSKELVGWFRWGIGLMSSYPESPDDVPAGLELPVWRRGG
jgi:hemoglobin